MITLQKFKLIEIKSLDPLLISNPITGDLSYNVREAHFKMGDETTLDGKIDIINDALIFVCDETDYVAVNCLPLYYMDKIDSIGRLPFC